MPCRMLVLYKKVLCAASAAVPSVSAHLDAHWLQVMEYICTLYVSAEIKFAALEQYR